MPIRLNPFRKQDENVRPVSSGIDRPVNGTPTKPIDISVKEPAEYKLSEINDSGVFVPPSPPERKSFWTTSSSRSTTSSNHRSVFNENEPFNISRESFDSYRRSFDISARSPMLLPEQKPRASLDSRTFQPLQRSSNSFQRPLQVPGTQKEEEADTLVDVALDDPKPQQAKKRGVFSRLMDSDSHSERPGSQDGTGSKGSWHHFGGRKRGQSGQGAELGSIPKREETPRPDSSHLKQESSLPKPESGQPAKQDERSAASAESESNQSKQEETPAAPAVQSEAQAKPGAENSQAPDVRTVESS